MDLVMKTNNFAMQNYLSNYSFLIILNVFKMLSVKKINFRQWPRTGPA